MLDQVGNQNVGFLMTRLICVHDDDNDFDNDYSLEKIVFIGDVMCMFNVKDLNRMMKNLL